MRNRVFVAQVIALSLFILHNHALATPSAPSPTHPQKTNTPTKVSTTKETPATPNTKKPNLKDLRWSFRPGKGLEVRAPHDYFVLRTRLRAQFLYTLSAKNAKDPEQSFQIRRARVTFTGSFFGKHNKYKVELAVSPRDLSLGENGVGRSSLLDWFFDFDHLRDLSLRIGQYKVGYSRQRVISSGNLEFVDRSIVNSEFNLDRDLGLELFSKDLFGLHTLRYRAGISTGEGHSSFANDDFGMMYFVRLEATPLGAFKDDYKEGALRRHLRPKLSLGAGYAFVDLAKKNRGILGSTPADGGTTNTHNANVDLMFKWHGFALQSAFMWRQGTRTPGQNKDDKGQPIPTEKPRDGFGIFAQTSYILSASLPLQFALRYSHIQPLDTASSSLSERNAIGGSISYYFGGHSFKIQADYFRFWSNDPAKGDNLLRIQLQGAL